jgi:MoxR-like ATPase
VPGIAKTLSARVVAKIVDTNFSRIQFTPDLMPSDILGTSIFDTAEGVFKFRKGPIFSNVILIDEINRAPAKSQAALFEVMEERQITFDGERYPMEYPFLVIATQNPIEQEGTYRLPEAQLDRFLFRIIVDYPNFEEEFEILKRFNDATGRYDLKDIQPIFTKEKLESLQKASITVHLEDDIRSYIVNLVQATRSNTRLFLGASPRASLAIMRASRVVAMLSGRGFVIPDDVQYIAPFVLNHRILLTPESEISGMDTFSVIQEIINEVEVPR